MVLKFKFFQVVEHRGCYWEFSSELLSYSPNIKKYGSNQFTTYFVTI